MIPAFDPVTNALPAYIHESDWAEIVARFGSNVHRTELLTGLRKALVSLADAGCTRVYLGGSFVTAKVEPGDWDGCWETAGVNFFRLDKAIAATNTLLMPAVYRGEIYRATDLAITGETFIEFFQHGRDRVAVGMVALNPASAR